MSARRVAVITGGTRGIGLGLAREYLQRGHAVMLTGRDAEAVARRVAELAPGASGGVAGAVCEVTDADNLQALWDEAVARFGRVDHWINNAGRNNPKATIDRIPWAEIESTIDVNLLGLMRGSLVAFRGLQTQPGGGWIFNMEGFGSDGMIGLEQVPYGVSKYAVRYFTRALARTAADTPVRVGFLSPGIVTTEMAVPPPDRRDEFFDRNRRLLNILADHVETVTPWMVERMLAAEKNGAAIRWMGYGRAAGRFVGSLFRRRHVIEEAMAKFEEGS